MTDRPQDWIKGQLAKKCGLYSMTMMREPATMILICLSTAAATPARAQTALLFYSQRLAVSHYG